MQILILDGSLGGASGNTAQILAAFARRIGPKAKATIVHLATNDAPTQDVLEQADAFVFSTGTYWDSWGSPLQKFFEDKTDLEGDTCWLGKPAAILNTMHSVGGKEILNRLHGVLNTFGLFIPPMCAFTYSFANHVALKNSLGSDDPFSDDLWNLNDLEIVADNLLTAARFGRQIREQWRKWPTDETAPNRQWLTLEED